MNYKALEIKRSYISRGDNNITNAFLVPALKCTKIYKRSVGFFSSSVMELIGDGVVSLVRNGGKIQLIASPKLSEEDVEAINLGYEKKEQLVSDVFTRDFYEEINNLSDEKLQMLCELIIRGVLDIKIAVTDDYGIYHDKLGVLRDFDDNAIAFYGSSNSSFSGYKNNYEKIRVSVDWKEGENDIVIEEEKEFDGLWNGTNKFVKVYEYTETAKKNLIKVIETRKSSSDSGGGVKLRDYQDKAIQAWVKNNYHGFYVMATGTGKTWTAIYSAIELLKTHSAMIVICAPYKHLVKQWSEDVEKVFPKAKIILVPSENPGWDMQISNEIIRKKYHKETQIILISTITSFNMERFKNTIKKSDEDKLLIVE